MERQLKLSLHNKWYKMAPTIKEIADRAKVSIATVSRALNNDKKVTEATRKLIHKISAELNYKPNLLARNFAKRTSNIVGLVLPDLRDEFFSEIIKGVDEITYKHGYYTMVASSHRYRSLEESLTTVAKNGLVGGLILLISSLTKQIREILDQSNLPVVLISGGLTSEKVDIVSIDNYSGAFDMTEFLIKKGYRKIAHITGPPGNDDSRLRERGFLEAMKKKGIVVHDSWIVKGNFTKESGEKACRKLISQKNKPEVIFASNDMMALGCFDVLNNLEIKIPEQMAVVGFDDIFISRYLTPGLTTVRVQIEEVGRKAAEILIRRLNGDNGKLHKSLISTELIVRDSC